jgi:hypothetical protein
LERKFYLKKIKFFGALTNRWWYGKGGRTWKAFFPSLSLSNYTGQVFEKNLYQKQKFQHFRAFAKFWESFEIRCV